MEQCYPILNRSPKNHYLFDIDQLTGKHDIKNDLLSNDFNNTYQFSRAGLSWRYQEKKYNFSIGAFVQQALLETAFHFLGRDSSLNKSFANFLPDAQVQ